MEDAVIGFYWEENYVHISTGNGITVKLWIQDYYVGSVNGGITASFVSRVNIHKLFSPLISISRQDWRICLTLLVHILHKIHINLTKKSICHALTMVFLFFLVICLLKSVIIQVVLVSTQEAKGIHHWSNTPTEKKVESYSMPVLIIIFTTL